MVNSLPVEVQAGITTGHLAHHELLHAEYNKSGHAEDTTIEEGQVGHDAIHELLRTWYNANNNPDLAALPLRSSASYGPAHEAAHEALHAYYNVLQQPDPDPTTPAGLTVGKILVSTYAAAGSVNNDLPQSSALLDKRNWNEHDDPRGDDPWWVGLGNDVSPIPNTVKHTYPAIMKRFKDSWITKTELEANLRVADTYGFILVQCTKCGSDWAGVADGSVGASHLADYAQVAKDRLAAGGKNPFYLTLHHEPNNDYNGTTATMATWADMQEHASYYFAGMRNGPGDTTYVRANDVRAGLVYGPIPNGFLITNQVDEVNTLVPPSLINAINDNGGCFMNDVYDGRTGNQRLEIKVEWWAKWCRADADPPGGDGKVFCWRHQVDETVAVHGNAATHPKVKHWGIAETGCYDLETITATWLACKAAKDVLRFVIYWSSGIGPVPDGATDWRLIPDGYPIDPAGGHFPTKGTQVQEEMLEYWRGVAMEDAIAIVGRKT